jgi:hypothetical protein
MLGRVVHFKQNRDFREKGGGALGPEKSAGFEGDAVNAGAEGLFLGEQPDLIPKNGTV